MGWSQGQPILLLGVEHVEFTGDDGKLVKLDRIQFVDGNPPQGGEGFKVTDAKVTAATPAEVKPGYWLAGVTWRTFRGGAAAVVTLQSWLGDLPNLEPANVASRPVSK